jgi:outer membrane protein TolC
MNTMNWKTAFFAGTLALALFTAASAQEPGPAHKLTLKEAVALAVQNSRELALARVQSNVADKTVAFNRAQFLPNLYSGSGAAYTYGFPLTAAGGAPSVFNTEYVQTVFNPPLRGEFRASQERAEAQRLGIDQVRDAVILHTASAYLELAKVRHSLELLRRERQSAQRIVDVTRERLSAGVELPIELTRAQLSAARIEQRVVHLEGREETLEGELRGLMGLPADERIEVATEELPASAEQPVRQLVDLALVNNIELKQAEAERRAREHLLKGQRGGYWPTLDLMGEYSLYSNVNNFDQFFRRFRRHSLNLGVGVRIPIFSSRTTAAVALAKSGLSAAELQVKSKRSDLEVEVRRQARRTRELDVNREVARLDLQLAQENLGVLQAQFQEGRASLRDLEKARLEESDKWMAFLDTDYERQQAQLELLRATGQLAKLFQ